MTNEEVAQAFADGKTKGKSLHMFIDGNTVYSYGKHFPIATRHNNGIVYFTTRGYSRTTSRHKSLVRCALPCEPVMVTEPIQGPNQFDL